MFLDAATGVLRYFCFSVIVNDRAAGRDSRLTT